MKSPTKAYEKTMKLNFFDESKYGSSNDFKKTDRRSVSMSTTKQNIALELDNSMMFKKTINDLSRAEDSFLALEQRCNNEDKHARLINDNETTLFDIEPPSELWNQTENPEEDFNKTEDGLDKTEDEFEDGSIEISPIKYIGLIRPSTIIEETSSQFESSSTNVSSLIKSSLYETASINESGIELSTESRNEIKTNYMEFKTPPERKSITKIAEFQNRGTFAFKRSNYTFFPDENQSPFNKITSFPEIVKELITNKNVQDLSPSDNSEDEDQFNNTLERVDYLLEKGKGILGGTPVADRHQINLLGESVFSCKRKRLITEMASIEMLPISKRGTRINQLKKL